MPSLQHEALVSLFHNEPLLAQRLLERVFAIHLPEHTATVLQDVTANEIAPTEYRADAVVVLREDDPVLAIIVEIQLAEDPRKSYSWPVYTTTLRARLECPVALLVVSPYSDVATWAARSIELGPRSTFSALVVGPDLVPVVSEVEEARCNPELAVLSVLAHGKEPRAESLAATALAGVLGLDAERATLYCDLILSALDGAVRVGLEEMMKIKYEFQSDYAKEYIALGREEAREEAREEGRRVGVRMLYRILRHLDLDLDDHALADRIDVAPVEVLERIADEVVSARNTEKVLAVLRQNLDDHS